MKIEEIEAKPWHCGQLARTLRAEHREILDDMNIPTHRELRDVFEASSIKRAWLLDGKLVALAGVTGPASTSDGTLWLALTDEMTKHPIAVGRHALRFMSRIMRTKRRLSTTVLSGDKSGVAFAYFLGFMVDGREPINGTPAMQMSYSERKAA